MDQNNVVADNIVDHVLQHPDVEHNPDYTPAGVKFSKKERKRMMAREHNRAYAAGELNKHESLRDIVLGTIGHAKISLGL